MELQLIITPLLSVSVVLVVASRGITVPSLALRGMLQADRRTSLPESPSSMDTPGCSRDWNRRPFLESVDPRPTLNRELGSAFTSPGVKDEEKEQGGFRRYKSVTMAPTSTYLSDRQYVTRRPLFPAEPQASILKKTNVQTSQREEVRGKDGASYMV